jgi:hypothetical protein
MKTWIKIVIVTVVIAIPAFLLEPRGPLGGFWAPHHAIPTPPGGLVPFFLVLGLLDALSLGAAVSFLIFGYPLVASIGASSRGLTFAAHLAIVWVLGNWWAHDSLHQHHGFDLIPLLRIEYGFHVTLMIAGAILGIFFMKALSQKTELHHEGYKARTKVTV